jgi:hypothetical protein
MQDFLEHLVQIQQTLPLEPNERQVIHLRYGPGIFSEQGPLRIHGAYCQKSKFHEARKEYWMPKETDFHYLTISKKFHDNNFYYLAHLYNAAKPEGKRDFWVYSVELNLAFFQEIEKEASFLL